jgi:hypothetical protein
MAEFRSTPCDRSANAISNSASSFLAEDTSASIATWRFDPKLNAWESRIPSTDSVRGYGDYSARWLDPESGRQLGRPME